MRIIGIDPGSRITGYGVIEVQGQSFKHLDCGGIHVKEGDPGDRLHQIFEGLQTIIETYQPDASAIEQVFMGKSAGSALKLGQARGAAMVALAHAGLTVAEYSARQIKQAVVGYGAADKDQVQHMVKVLLNLPEVPAADPADALAVAIAHANFSQGAMKLGGAVKLRKGRLRNDRAFTRLINRKTSA